MNLISEALGFGSETVTPVDEIDTLAVAQAIVSSVFGGVNKELPLDNISVSISPDTIAANLGHFKPLIPFKPYLREYDMAVTMCETALSKLAADGFAGLVLGSDRFIVTGPDAQALQDLLNSGQ